MALVESKKSAEAFAEMGRQYRKDFLELKNSRDLRLVHIFDELRKNNPEMELDDDAILEVIKAHERTGAL